MRKEPHLSDDHAGMCWLLQRMRRSMLDGQVATACVLRAPERASQWLADNGIKWYALVETVREKGDNMCSSTASVARFRSCCAA